MDGEIGGPGRQDATGSGGILMDGRRGYLLWEDDIFDGWIIVAAGMLLSCWQINRQCGYDFQK